MAIGELYTSCTHFGLVSASRFEFDSGEQIVLLRVGKNMSVHLPYEQAVALRADLDEALALFDHAPAAIPDRGQLKAVAR